MGGLICGSMVGHFWTFLLKPPQPLMGLFLNISLFISKIQLSQYLKKKIPEKENTT